MPAAPSSFALRLPRRTGEGAAGICEHGELAQAEVAGLAVDLDLDRTGARRPVVHAGKRGLLRRRRRAVRADRFDNGIAAGKPDDFGECEAVLGAPEATLRDLPFFRLAALGL